MIPQHKEKSLMNFMFGSNETSKRFHPYDKVLYHNNSFSCNSFNAMNAICNEPHQEYYQHTLSNAHIWLENHLLWNQFHLFGNEMIITKPGRRMFPVLGFSIFGLNPTYYYRMEAEITPADNNRYKYVNVSGWRVNGVASKQEGNKKMFHPDGLQLGDYWQRNGIVFKRIKLTNKKSQKEGSNQIVVNSMHKYEIKLNISSYNENQEFLEFREVPFKETQFIAVTAYQNDDVTQLKIDHNPFAKAFRDTNSTDIAGNYDAMFSPGQMTSTPMMTSFIPQNDKMKTTNHLLHHKHNEYISPSTTSFDNRIFSQASSYFSQNNNKFSFPFQWNIPQQNVNTQNSSYNTLPPTYWRNNNQLFTTDCDNNNNPNKNNENTSMEYFWKSMENNIATGADE